MAGRSGIDFEMDLAPRKIKGDIAAVLREMLNLAHGQDGTGAVAPKIWPIWPSSDRVTKMSWQSRRSSRVFACFTISFVTIHTFAPDGVFQRAIEGIVAQDADA